MDSMEWVMDSTFMGTYSMECMMDSTLIPWSFHGTFHMESMDYIPWNKNKSKIVHLRNKNNNKK